ncbi:hypothetical protein D9758_000663 [Tetrapyrgos nigripes]|uniref:Ubiquitin carboxyl-terminal hydrolase n=1 Tax=Tetrapyrgos nigripes TaxID=182062 RepID=A0A8H5GYJ5_9AGAR|nr:hypothetical protein D9758_000663 [Tetrapyrgos nigripes]
MRLATPSSPLRVPLFLVIYLIPLPIISMAPRRRERVSPSSQGLAPGERLDRDALAGNASSTWGWVGTEASNTSEITTNHLLAACGLLDPSRPFCRNKFKETSRASSTDPLAIKDTDDDVIVISDDETPTCSKKSCKSNPFCLNYLGQDKWENDEHQETFKELAKVGSNPSEETRIDDLPVGLRNLGATCYANASLQVWFRDLAFRAGVFNCRPLEGLEDKFQESPIFQLQVTFAALQESKQMVFNPTKLVESLQLRTGEQQDAQEFSKLFMSHLDAEFKKQPTPSLRTLVHDQFEGKLVYGTICACQYRSERSSDFLEIEVNFKNNQKLEDCLEFFLETEKLSGDNQYCDSLQDATRYTELRELPPVLHFSLLRFVYDLSTMERKKSKNTILFPKRLRMGHFLGNSTQRQQARTASTDEDTYELSGILLHKGTSAYHGHYEAQAFDPRSGSWYQFNDEVVTQIKSLGDKKPKKVEVDIESDDEGESKKQATGTKRKKKLASNSRKRQRVDDSEVESPERRKPYRPTPTLAPSAESSHISSKDAYMLIYTRVKTEGNLTGPSRKSKSIESTPEPPSQALQVIGRLNETHVAACEDYARRVKMLEDTFAELKLKVQEVYCNWNLSSITEDWVVTSRKTLEGWLSKYSMQSVLSQQRVPDAAEAHDPASSAAKQTIMSVEDILCEHARLDYRKVAQMKVIHRVNSL